MSLFPLLGRWRVQCVHHKADPRTGEPYTWHHGPCDWPTAHKLAELATTQGCVAVVEPARRRSSAS